MNLSVPLSMDQIKAAQMLHGRLISWKTTDQALQDLARRFNEFDSASVLIKVATLNQLYGTNVYAVTRMAEHVTKVMAEKPATIPNLVDRLASLPKAPGQQSQRNHLSFASKFAHFFIDPERFPIYDSYAAKMLSYHLDRREIERDKKHPYQAFVNNFLRLKERAHLSCTTRELDRYLWLAGLHLKFRKDRNAKINVDARKLFASSSRETVAELKAMLPPILA